MKKIDSKNIIENLEKENKILKSKVSKLESKIILKDNEMEHLKYFYYIENEKINFERFVRLNIHYIRNNGILKYISSVFKSLFRVFGLAFKKVWYKFFPRPELVQLRKILKEHKGKRIIVFYPGYEWYMKMYQRPQHIAVQMAKKDILYFYCTQNFTDNINGFKKIQENLYVTNQLWFLKKYLPKYTLQLYANMNGCWLPELKEIQESGNDILYEYIDDLHEDLTVIPKELLERHKYALSDESIKVVATSNHLYKKALKYRKKNIILSTNGVVYEDFHINKKPDIPEKIKDIVNQKKPIIGYYGALASWFDYDLIKKLANERKDLNILLIGIDYDGTLEQSDILSLKNVYYIGTVDYKELVNYGYYCNVLTIPFVINEITLATSPVKIFEYMSMEKPIVTTDLPECRKYKSVFISKNHENFIKNIDKALNSQNDEKYKTLLKCEALKNTWSKKVDEILELLNTQNEDGE